MTPERWQQIKQVFEAALTRLPSERSDLLDETCRTDYSLRQEVEVLLASHMQAGNFLETPAAGEVARLIVAPHQFAPGQHIGRYEIISALGAGGMGEVYLAQDTRLDRQVALKVLPSGMVEHQDRLRRFIQEAKAASSLNHPNIITIHEIGSSGDTHFIATEFIDGQTLRRKLHAARLKSEEAVEIAMQIAAALDAAHRSSIVHRDIKPENIMMREDGLVKVLDFGLAKLSESQNGLSSKVEAATRVLIKSTPGLVMGTVHYMSPEQARGKEVDARTDIFSLGVVLYEMLAGRLPFGGETTSDVIAAILTSRPGPPSDFDQKIPAELNRIVSQTLAKMREERYQTAKDLLGDLRQLQKRLEFEAELERAQLGVPALGVRERKSLPPEDGAPGPRNSIAVLPFANLSTDPENEYFCDGLAEELINALAKIDELKVAARTSAFSFKGRNPKVSEIGNALNVNTVLEGSVRKSGNRVRITAQLVNAMDGYHLWSERYDSEMKDIFDVQDEITLAVVDALKLELFSDEKVAVLKRHTDNIEAYHLYLRGLSYASRFTMDAFHKAIESFHQAITLDRHYALAYAGLSVTYTGMAFTSPPCEAMPKAKEAASKALELDDTLAEAHNSLAIIKMYSDWDYPGAEQEFRVAITLNPGSSYIHNWYGWYLGLMGRFDESLKELRRAQELDPLSDQINSAIGIIFYWARQPERAIEEYRKVIELNPAYYMAYIALGEAYEQMGDFQAAVTAIEKARQLAIDLGGSSALAHAYAKSGDRDRALEILNRLKESSVQQYEPAFKIAQIYAGLGVQDQAFAWLEKAYEERSVWLPWLRVDPKLEPLRSEVRFADLMRRVGFSG